MSVDSSPWILPNLPSGDYGDDSRGQTTPGSVAAAHLAVAADARENLLADLHDEAAGLRQQSRLGKLSPSGHEYLADLQREIDHHESFRPSLRDGDLWARIDALAERVLASRK
jgi:hypothetical protein